MMMENNYLLLSSPLSLFVGGDAWADGFVGFDAPMDSADDIVTDKKYSDGKLLADDGAVITGLAPQSPQDIWLIASPLGQGEKNTARFLQSQLRKFSFGIKPPLLHEKSLGGRMGGVAGVKKKNKVVMALSWHQWLLWAEDFSYSRLPNEVAKSPFLLPVGSAWQLVRVMARQEIVYDLLSSFSAMAIHHEKNNENFFIISLQGEDLLVWVEKDAPIASLLFFIPRGIAESSFRYLIELAMVKTNGMTRVVVENNFTAS